MIPKDFSLPDWSRALGAPASQGVIRQSVEDFHVCELPLIEPTGEGSHLWLEIEKRNANTNWVARQLARAAGVARRDVGFAGMKDRHGVTRQWFSVAMQEAAASDWENWSWPDVVVLQALRHGRKLKRGALRGNRFRIVIRDLQGNSDELEGRLDRVAAQGVPNYFGPQRFGRGGANFSRGVRWLDQGGRLPREKKSIYLSAVRSFLFNQVLARRVDLGTWNRIIEGDIASLAGSRSTFACVLPDPELEQRCKIFDIHPTGPLPGKGGKKPVGPSGEIELSTLEPYRYLAESLGRAGLEAGRRSLRLKPENMGWAFGPRELSLEFELPPGGYATTVLRELVSVASVSISESK